MRAAGDRSRSACSWPGCCTSAAGGGRKGIRGAGAYQIVYFFPQLLSLVIIAVLWKFVYNPNTGLLNGALRAVGLDGLARSWLAEPELAFWR